jgi:hypothetical protein
MLRKNINNQGRMIRLVIAVLLLVYAIWYSSWIALLLSLFTFFESFFSWCVLYQIMGWNSCEAGKK